MKNFIIGLVMACLVLIGAAPSHAAWVPVTGTLGSTASNCGAYNTEADLGSVYMVGDSITVQGRNEIKALRPSWEVNGLTSRTVDCLPGHVDRRLARGYMGKLVIALGTNAIVGWNEARYREVIATAKAANPRVTVTFVTTYRDRDIFNAANGYAYRTLASTQYYTTQWMLNIAKDTPNVCIANWRGYVMNREHLLSDGVHPNTAGQAAWAEIVKDAVADCNAPAQRKK